jgi:plasmid stabilization system protein ParE
MSAASREIILIVSLGRPTQVTKWRALFTGRQPAATSPGFLLTIARESASRVVAETFIDKLTSHCDELARLPGLLSRARPELGRDYRSISFGSYVIIMRYSGEAGPRSHLYVVRIIHGARDLQEHWLGLP